MSLFPFFLLALALLGRSTADVEQRNAVLDFVLRYFPAQFDFITKQLDAFRADTITLGVAGTIALVWGALGVFGAISTAVNYAWGVEKQRSFWKHKLFSFVMLLLRRADPADRAAAHQRVSRWSARAGSRDVLLRFPGLEVLRSFTIRHATTLLFILVVGLIYYFVPNAKVRFRDVWIGALVTGLLWKGALEGFSWYMRDMTPLHPRQRIDRRRRRVPGVGLPAGGDSAVRRRVHCRVRAAATRPAGRCARRRRRRGSSAWWVQVAAGGQARSAVVGRAVQPDGDLLVLLTASVSAIQLVSVADEIAIGKQAQAEVRNARRRLHDDDRPGVRRRGSGAAGRARARRALSVQLFDRQLPGDQRVRPARRPGLGESRRD